MAPAASRPPPRWTTPVLPTMLLLLAGLALHSPSIRVPTSRPAIRRAPPIGLSGMLTGAAAPVIKTVCNVLLQNVQKRGRRRRSRPATSDSESDLEDQGDSSQIVLLQHHNSARSLFHRGKQNSHKIIEMPTDMIDYTTE